MQICGEDEAALGLDQLSPHVSRHLHREAAFVGGLPQSCDTQTAARPDNCFHGYVSLGNQVGNGILATGQEGGVV